MKNYAMSVPCEVREAIAGRPLIGEWDPMFPLLTVDDIVFPHVCLLGRAELESDGSHLYAVLASATTIANIRRTGRATLIVVGSDAAIYCKLTVDGEPIENGASIGVSFAVASSKRDGVGVPVQPATFLVTQAITETEGWEGSARVLARLSRH